MSARPRLRVGVLVSGGGTNLQAILDASQRHEIDVDVTLVISNRAQAYALERARAARVPARVIGAREYASREAFEQAMIDALRAEGVEWVVLAGFMRLLSGHFLRAFPQRVINIHPSLLPAFPGLEAQAQAFAYGVKLAGCTVHFVDEGTDSGPIIAQAAVAVLEDDDVERLQQRILAQEHRLLPAVLQLAATDRLRCEGRRVRVLPARESDPVTPSAALVAPAALAEVLHRSASCGAVDKVQGDA